ncbi:unnamed protein product [Adineta steineri]|uniref:G-protein coupled receptors family 1 profile domain-containing protein n=1 Tax=Adineta steineri TaxID=433720 RepID=A0A819JA31_9BILA|nr:unnamed protein product [Adineta steineri]CAF1261021.1 unnamed protein product [Adineta steineri]CAF3930483.1 unnamed protein product [Adineta steineri]
MATTTQTLASQLSNLSNKLLIYYLAPIYVFGTLGNILNIIIFLRRNLRSSACSQYFICMSMAQIILFNAAAINRTIALLIGYDLSTTVNALCKLRIYFYLSSLGIMRQCLCLISIDRWIITTKSASIRKFSSLRNVRWQIIGSTLFWILYSIHTLIGYQLSPPRGCTNLVDPSYSLFYAIQIIISASLTWIIMIVFSILTLRNVRSSRRIQIVTQNTGNTTVVLSNTPQSIHQRRREMQLIKLSLIQVISYILLCTIASAYPLYMFTTSSQKKSSNQTAIESFLTTVGLLLLYTYSAITFLIYTLASNTFRKELLLMCQQVFTYMTRLLF